MKTFRAAPDLYLCFDHGDAVALDLRRNLYIALPNAGIDSLERTAAALVLRTRGSRAEAQVMEFERAAPSGALHCAVRPRVSSPLRSMSRFLAACVWSELQLRLRRLDLTTRRFARRSRAVGGYEQCARIVGEFIALRPWWPRARRCLFDSLALGAFLQSHGIDPELVFGVRARPFHAHCWLEHEGVVLNDAIERIAGFSAIAWR